MLGNPGGHVSRPTDVAAAACSGSVDGRTAFAIGRTPGSVRVELLGGFRLVLNGEPRRLPLSVQRVVAFVALARRPIQRVYVAGSLWTDSSPEQANASLRTALWRLGQLGVQVIDPAGNHLAVAHGVEVDAQKVAGLAQTAIASGSPRALDDLCAAGELLPDWYDEWLVLERERLRQLRLHGLEALCASLTASRRFGEAVLVGTAAVAGEPLRESAHRVLIEAYLAEGNACDALRQYELCRELLARHLGLPPSAALERLVVGLRNAETQSVNGRRRRRLPTR